MVQAAVPVSHVTTLMETASVRTGSSSRRAGLAALGQAQTSLGGYRDSGREMAASAGSTMMLRPDQRGRSIMRAATYLADGSSFKISFKAGSCCLSCSWRSPARTGTGLPSGTLRYYDIIDLYDTTVYLFDIIVYHNDTQYHMYDIIDMILHMISWTKL
jgi:hypothetical protein